MGGPIDIDEDGTEFPWIKMLEDQRNPPMNTLTNICAHYVADHIYPIVVSGSKTDECSASRDVEMHVDVGGVKSSLEASSSDSRYDRGSDRDVWSTRVDFSDESSRESHENVVLRRDVDLPIEVSQKVFDFLKTAYTSAAKCEIATPVDLRTCVAAFGTFDHGLGRNRMPLWNLDFGCGSEIDDEYFKMFMQSNSATVKAIDISNCEKLTHGVLSTINDYGGNLKSITFGNCTQILQRPHQELEKLPLEGKILWGPKSLWKFVLYSFDLTDVYVQKLIGNYLHTLQYLDLSKCTLHNFSFLRYMPSLKTLILYNVDLMAESKGGFFENLTESSNQIRHLDISQSNSGLTTLGTYRCPNNLLAQVAKTLVNLKSLDISNTNLAGTGVAQLTLSEDYVEYLCDIPGLNCRSRDPLEYIGLYNTAYDASRRHNIPAKQIGGDRDELQMLNAARVFITRSEVLERILNDLFHIYRSENGKHVLECLRLILLAMETHENEKHIQISGSASLFYIVKNNTTNAKVGALKRRILMAIVMAMHNHHSDPTMLRNGCLTICHFRIPADVMFLYKKLVKILLAALSINQPASNEDFVERIAIYLLNSLACQVDEDQKRLVGQLGAMQKMLALIETRLYRQECDDVMEIAWSTMWNVTDETPDNCQKFLENNGMNLFQQCLDQFPDNPELLRNMMGLLGNVAEVHELRPRLMTPIFIEVFYNLLDSKKDKIEVSYNAAGVLAHLLSDEESIRNWVDKPARSDVCARMKQNINSWDLKSTRNINYRSFKPILRLLKVDHTIECRLWAAWALANLTTVYPDKYVRLLKDEGGLNDLQEELTRNQDRDLTNYANIAIKNVELHLIEVS